MCTVYLLNTHPKLVKNESHIRESHLNYLLLQDLKRKEVRLRLVPPAHQSAPVTQGRGHLPVAFCSFLFRLKATRKGLILDGLFELLKLMCATGGSCLVCLVWLLEQRSVYQIEVVFASGCHVHLFRGPSDLVENKCLG